MKKDDGTYQAQERDTARFRRKRCGDETLADIIRYLERIKPKSRFNDDVRKEISQLTYNLSQGHPFTYCVGQSHTMESRLKNRMVNAGLMTWERGHRVSRSVKVSVASPTPLFFAVVNRHCQLKHGDGHIGYFDDPATMKELAEFNAFMAQHTFTYACGDIEPVHRINYVKNPDGQGIIRQRLISDIHNKKNELRPTIEINGMSTVQFDVTATHPQLLLHKYEKQAMAFDPYDIAPDHDYGKELRNAAKLAVMMMLNTSGRKSAGAAFRKELSKPEKDEEKELNKRATRIAIASFTRSQIEILDMVYDRNPLLRPFFYNEPHRELMHMDGNIAWDCMRRLAAKGIPALSVHDEVIIQHQHLDVALETYKRCWIKETGIEGLGIEPTIKIKD